MRLPPWIAPGMIALADVCSSQFEPIVVSEVAAQATSMGKSRSLTVAAGCRCRGLYCRHPRRRIGALTPFTIGFAHPTGRGIHVAFDLAGPVWQGLSNKGC